MNATALEAAVIEAAINYGHARAVYHEAFEAWRKAHPAEYEAAVDAKAPFAANLSWRENVAGVCTATVDAQCHLEAAAERLYDAHAAELEEVPSRPVASGEPCVDCGAPNAPMDRGERLCPGCSAERDRVCAGASHV